MNAETADEVTLGLWVTSGGDTLLSIWLVMPVLVVAVAFGVWLRGWNDRRTARARRTIEALRAWEQFPADPRGWVWGPSGWVWVDEPQRPG